VYALSIKQCLILGRKYSNHQKTKEKTKENKRETKYEHLAIFHSREYNIANWVILNQCSKMIDGTHNLSILAN
jgi:hypothetical protein